MPNNTLVRVRWVKGGRVQWDVRFPSGRNKTFINDSLKYASIDDLIKAFDIPGWGFSTAIVEECRVVVCSRCDGKGRYCGGLCFSCRGARSRLVIIGSRKPRRIPPTRLPEAELPEDPALDDAAMAICNPSAYREDYQARVDAQTEACARGEHVHNEDDDERCPCLRCCVSKVF